MYSCDCWFSNREFSEFDDVLVELIICGGFAFRFLGRLGCKGLVAVFLYL